MTSTILALDLGTAGLGWAIGDRYGQIALNHYAHLPIPVRHMAMCDRLSVKLTLWVEKLEPELVVIERPFFSRATPAAGVLLYQLLGVAGVVLYRKGIDVKLAEIWDWQAWAKPRGWVKEAGDDGNDAAWMLRWLEAGAPVRERKPKPLTRRQRVAQVQAALAV